MTWPRKACRDREPQWRRGREWSRIRSRSRSDTGCKRIAEATVYAGWAQKDPLALNGSCASAVTWKLRPARTGVAVGEMASHSSRAPHFVLPAGRPIQLARVRMAVINSVFSSDSSGFFGYSIEPLNCAFLLSGSGYSSATLLGLGSKSLLKNIPNSKSNHIGIASSDWEITSGGVSNMPKTKHPTMM